MSNLWRWILRRSGGGRDKGGTASQVLGALSEGQALPLIIAASRRRNWVIFPEGLALPLIVAASRRN